MRRILITAAAFGLLGAGPVTAANFTELAAPSSSNSSISSIGIEAPTRVRELNLGALRTDEARLPGGVTSRADRMRLRAVRAEERRLALDEAKRKKAEEEEAKK